MHKDRGFGVGDQVLKLWDWECTCGCATEELVEGDEMLACPKCGAEMRRVPFLSGSATRAQTNPAKTREMFSKAAEMRNKVTGKTPWRKTSYSQTGNE